MGESHRPDVCLCVDFGSTFTKASLVDLGTGAIVAAADHPTTLPVPGEGGDVLDGYAACRDALTAQDARAAHAEVLACSSAGGGLRIAVVGNEELVTAEAGRRVQRLLNLDSEARYSLESIDSYEDAAGRAAELGFDEVISHWPRREGIYAGDDDVLYEVASRF